MKVLKSISLVVTMLLTLVGYATDGNGFSLVEGTKKVKVVFDDVKKGNVLVIKSKKGEIFHKEEILKNGKCFRVFDFSKLEDGNYEIDLKKETEILRKPFVIHSHALIFKKEIKTIIHKPVIDAHDDIIEVKDLYTEDQSAEVIILFNDEEILNEELSHKGDHLNKKYKLDHLEKGVYTIIVHNEGKSYIKEFKKK